MTPEVKPELSRDEQETLKAICEGLADVPAGRTKSLAEFEREFRQRHAIVESEFHGGMPGLE